MNSFFYQSNYLRAGGMSVVSGRCFAQEARRHVPMLAIFGDDRNGLLIIAGEHSNQRLTAFRLKGDAVADLEVQHLRVRRIWLRNRRRSTIRWFRSINSSSLSLSISIFKAVLSSGVTCKQKCHVILRSTIRAWLAA